MIQEALLHCPGIGPSRLEQLHAKGIRSWNDMVHRAADIVSARWVHAAIEESERSLDALSANRVDYFVDRFHPKDRWRILSQYLENVSYFDIETDGLEHDASITTIACWHRGRVHMFVENENLDDFLDLLDDVTLLSSFNGSTFDVPRVLDTFHIPTLPCPHLDLRWLCFHRNLRGGLKDVTARLRIRRPEDLLHADGEQAIRLWKRWEHFQDRSARDLLVRYAASDVLLLIALADRLLDRNQVSLPELWSALPGQEAVSIDETGPKSIVSGQCFGDGSPTKLRGRRVG